MNFKIKSGLIVFFSLILIGSICVIGTIANANYQNLKDGEWICIAQQCDDWAIGDDWVSYNCRPQLIDNINQLICHITIEDKEYDVPLTDITKSVNISELKSCRKYVCSAEIFVRGKIK